MSLFQALAYFLTEASRNLVRGWRISALAVATTALSLFVGGLVVLLTGNITRAMERWRSDAQIVVYLDESLKASEIESLSRELSALPWTESLVEVGQDAARERFRTRFPDLREVLDELERSPFPTSLEIKAKGEPAEIAARVAALSELEGVKAVDSDAQWLDSINAAAAVAGVFGLVIGAVLMVAAAVSIASVVRLSTFVYRREVAAMRLIGATEFFVRGPFVVEGVLQGLAGAGLALATLWLGHWALGEASLPWFVQEALIGSFLTPPQALALLTLGVTAGLVGGLIPVRERAGVFG